MSAHAEAAAVLLSFAQNARENKAWDKAQAFASAAQAQATLAVAEQKQGCNAHRVIPILLRNWAEPIDASEQDNWVKYQIKAGGEFTNGAQPTGYSSEEIHACKDKMALGMVADQFKELRERFGAEIVG